MHGTCGLINPWHHLRKMSSWVGNPGRPPYVIPRGSAGLKKKVWRRKLRPTELIPPSAIKIIHPYFSDRTKTGISKLISPCALGMMVYDWLKKSIHYNLTRLGIFNCLLSSRQISRNLALYCSDNWSVPSLNFIFDKNKVQMIMFICDINLKCLSYIHTHNTFEFFKKLAWHWTCMLNVQASIPGCIKSS